VVGKTFPAHILPTDHTKIIVDVKFSWKLRLSSLL
jgi:hypothetical protein